MSSVMSRALTLLKVLGGGVDELHGDELEATLLKPADDVADESALDTVGLTITIRDGQRELEDVSHNLDVP